MLNRADLESLHKFSSAHRGLLAGASRAGCFHCGAIFSPADILEWIDTRDDGKTGGTAFCPRCGIDAVLPETAMLSVTPALLDAMRAHWFA